jgi:DNA-binding transcriptional ArsR family regulator
MADARGAAARADVDRTLAALADPHRRQVVDLLSRGPRAAGDLARELALSPPSMSRHLRTLRESGLVEESHPTFDARVRIYALRPEPMANLLRWLEEAERLWSEQLLAFKAHLERKAEAEPDAKPEADG